MKNYRNQKILSELARHGKVNIRRAYGNWTSKNLKGWEAALHEHVIQPIQQYDLTKATFGVISIHTTTHSLNIFIVNG